jgi:putative nucleotidyltransferase with HDIG domain
MNPLQTATKIISFYQKYGEADYIGEAITQNSHMIQASMLAEEIKPDDTEFILAAFLHDIGHLLAFDSNKKIDTMGGYGIKDHENLGAEYLLKHGFSTRVANLVRNHVSAKRYLCSTDPSYYDKLSPASQHTFQKQGSYLSSDEIKSYEEDPLHKDYCQLRLIDDQAKLTDVSLKPLSHYQTMIENYLLDRYSAPLSEPPYPSSSSSTSHLSL